VFPDSVEGGILYTSGPSPSTCRDARTVTSDQMPGISYVVSRLLVCLDYVHILAKCVDNLNFLVSDGPIPLVVGEESL
jgi:hypothetical protein